MDRIGIFSFYNANGGVGQYVDYLLSDLMQVLSRLIVVVNGSVSENGRKIFNKYTDEVIVRENVGFDAGAYADILLNYTTDKELQEYDEIVLCNDTFYGPFIPFKSIFDDMKNRGYDFWGLNMLERDFLSYIQSYFWVFGKRIVSKGLYREFFERISITENDLNNVYSSFELGAYRFFDGKCVVGSYTNTHLLDIYQSGIPCIEKYGLPIIKRKAFAERYSSTKKRQDMIEYLRTTTNYNVELILDDMLTGTDGEKTPIAVESDIMEEVFCVSPRMGYEEIEMWIGESEFYIYGDGMIGRQLYSVFCVDDSKFLGFVVSDGKRQKSKILGQSVYEYNEIDCNAKIIVGIGYKYINEIKCSMGERDNILYLW